MEKISLKSKLGRGALFTVITAVLIAVLLVGNIALAYLGQKKMLFLDLTPEGLYTLTDRMKDECDFVDELAEDGGKIKIIFCTDPDYLLASQITRIPYFMAQALDNEYDNIELETVNVALDPTSVAAYKTTSLSTITSSDIIVSYGGSYRIVSAKSFWTTNSDGSYFSYNGEYKMATLIKSLTAVERPVAYFVTNHGETYYNPDNEEMMKLSASFYDLLVARGLEVRTLDLLAAERVPEDCVLLIINNPRTDFIADPDQFTSLSDYTETDKLDIYLSRDEGAIILAKDYEITLPNLEEFAHEWGLDFGEGVVKDDISLGGALAGEDAGVTLGTDLIGIYNKDSESHAYAIYGDFAKLTSAPRFILKNAGFVKCAYNDVTSVIESGSQYAKRYYTSFFTTTKEAKSYIGDAILEADKGVKDTVAIATRSLIDSYTAESTYSYFVAANSKELLSSELLSNPSYANYDVMSALVSNISRIDYYASIELGGTSQNSTSFGGKQLADTKLSTSSTNVYSADAKEIIKVNHGISGAEIAIYAVVAILPAVAALVVGIVIRIKRKFL